MYITNGHRFTDVINGIFQLLDNQPVSLPRKLGQQQQSAPHGISHTQEPHPLVAESMCTDSLIAGACGHPTHLPMQVHSLGTMSTCWGAFP